jgi:hypothetical protein
MTDWYIYEDFYAWMSFGPAFGVTLPVVIYAVATTSCSKNRINPVVKIEEDRPNKSDDGEDEQTIQIMNNVGSKQLLEAMRKQNQLLQNILDRDKVF